MSSSRWMLFLGGLLSATAVAMGAFLSHGLEPLLVARQVDAAEIARRLTMAETAARYHLVHGVALVMLSILLRSPPPGVRGGLVAIASGLIVLGTLIFCGSLYAISVLDLTGLRRVAPYGGSTLIFGWICLAVAAVAGKTRVTGD